jgi:hypothetical protein
MRFKSHKRRENREGNLVVIFLQKAHVGSLESSRISAVVGEWRFEVESEMKGMNGW